MEPSDFVKIQIEQFTGEMMLEVEVAIRASAIEARAAGSNITWTAHGVRIVVPSAALETIRKTIAPLVSVKESEEGSAPTPPDQDETPGTDAKEPTRRGQRESP